MAATARSLSGCLLTLTLLVSLASSFVDQKQLKEMKANILSTYEELESIKERRADTTLLLELLGEYETLMRSFQVLLKKTPPEAYGFLPVESFIGKLADFLKNSKIRDEAHNEALGAEIDDLEQKLRGYEKFVETVEEQHSEL